MSGNQTSRLSRHSKEKRAGRRGSGRVRGRGRGRRRGVSKCLCRL